MKTKEHILHQTFSVTPEISVSEKWVAIRFYVLYVEILIRK